MSVHLLIGAVLFFGGHVVLSSPVLRPALVDRFGERGFAGVYAGLALLGLAWLIYGYSASDGAALWGGQGLAIAPLLAMAPAALLFVGAFSQKNPTAMGQAGSLSPGLARGMQRVTRHPFLWAVALWAASHLIANGDAASLVLFGGMLALALYGTGEIDRKMRARNPARWAEFAAVTSNLPFAAIASGRNRFVWSEIGWWRLALAALLYAVLIGAHPHVIGVSPVG